MSTYASTGSLGPQPRTISGVRRDDGSGNASNSPVAASRSNDNVHMSMNHAYSGSPSNGNPSLHSGPLSNSMSNLSSALQSGDGSNNINSNSNNSSTAYD